MSGRYDGSIRINTEIDTSNVNSQVMRVRESIRRLENEAGRLRDRLHELETTQIPTDEYNEISNKLERARNRLDQLIERQQRMQAEGRNSGAAWERINRQIEVARGEVGAVETQMQELVDTGRAFRLGRDTEEYRRTAEQLRRVESDIEINNRRLQEMRDRQDSASDGFREMADSASDGFKEIGNFAERSLRKMDNAVKRIRQSIGSLLGSSRKMDIAVKNLRRSIGGLLGSLGLGLGIAGLVVLGKESIELASDIREVQNVVDTAFGSMTYKMEKFADTAITQFGISKLSAKQTGSTFMAMGRSMIGSMEKASDMAVALTGRSADMASFFNKTAKETATALKSIYTGETETLKEYGVVMTEVNLQEYAYQKGIKKKLAAMTQEEKVMLRYNYVMEQTALAAGDFAKTSNSWANQTRILSEQFKELLSVIGNGLIVVFTPVVKFLNTILTQLIAIAEQAGAILSRLLGISIPTGDAGKLADELTGAADGADSLAEGIEAAGKAAEKALAPFDDLNVLDKNSGSSGSGSGTGGFRIPELEMDEAEEGTEELGEAAEKLMDILARLFDPVEEAWANEGSFVMDSWRYALDGILELVRQIGTDFLRMWDSPETAAILSDMLNITGDIGLVVGHLAENFREAWAENDTGYRILCNIRDIIGAIIHNMRIAADRTEEWADGLDFYPLLSKLEEWTEGLVPVYDTLSGILADFYTTVLLPLGQWTIEKGLPKLLQVFIDFNSKVDWESLRANMQELWEHLEPFAETVGEGLIIFIDRLADALADFLNSEAFVDFLHSVEDWMDNVTPEDVADALEKTAKAIIACKAALAGFTLAKGFVNFASLLSKISKLKGVSAILKGISGAIASLNISAIPDGISAMLNGISTGIAGVGGIANLFTLDITALVAEGGFAAAGTAIGLAIIGGVAAAIGGWNLGQLLNEKITGEKIDMSWMEQFDEIKNSFSDGSWKDALKLWRDDIGVNLKAMGDDVNGWLQETFGDWAGTTFADLGSDIKSWWDTDVKGALSLWGQDISAFWSENVEPWFTKEQWEKMGENMKTGISEKWTRLTEWWRNTGFYNWWNDDVAPWFEKDKWSFDGIRNGLESAWTAAIEGIKKIWNKFAGWLNEKLTWTIDPVSIAGKTVFEGTTINLGKIPMLADGAVIRGGDPFMAVLGDQPKGRTNIETPLPTMVQAFKQALAESGNTGSGEYTFIAQLNGKTIFEEVVNRNDMFKKSTGHSRLA